MLYSAWAYHKHCDSVYKRFLISGFFSPPSLPFSTDVLSVTGACFLPCHVGAHGWVARCACTKTRHALGPVCILVWSSAFSVQPFWCVRQLFNVLYSAWAYHKHCDSVYKWFLPSPFPLMFSVRRVPAFFPAMWGLMAGLPGFPSHRSSLHLGAGCQQWKLLGITSTQPPLSNAVVNTL